MSSLQVGDASGAASVLWCGPDVAAAEAQCARTAYEAGVPYASVDFPATASKEALVGTLAALPRPTALLGPAAEEAKAAFGDGGALTPETLLTLQLFDLAGGSSTFTYILADAESMEAVIIDPVLEQVDRDLAEVSRLGLTLTLAFNTHCHADHITGTGELKKRVPGLRSVIAQASGAQADVLCKPGDSFTFGRHTLEVRETPGHTDG